MKDNTPHAAVVKEDTIEAAIAVHDTIGEFVASAHPTSFYEDRFAGRRHVIFVGYIEEEPAGYLIAYDRDDDGSIYCWMAGVNPDYRQRGVLKALMQKLEEWSRSQGYDTMKIKTRNQRRAMLAYLVKYGFHFTEVLPQKKLEDHRICLEKSLV